MENKLDIPEIKLEVLTICTDGELRHRGWDTIEIYQEYIWLKNIESPGFTKVDYFTLLF